MTLKPHHRIAAALPRVTQPEAGGFKALVQRDWLQSLPSSLPVAPLPPVCSLLFLGFCSLDDFDGVPSVQPGPLSFS